MTKKKKICASLIMLAVFATTMFASAFLFPAKVNASTETKTAGITDVTDKYTELAYSGDGFGDTVKSLSEVAQNQKYVTFIASLDEQSISDVAGDDEVSEIVGTARYNDAAKKIKKAQKSLLRALKKAGIRYTVDSYYDTVIAGVAVEVETADFARAEEITESLGGTAIVSELYYPTEVYSATASSVTENIVNVHDTGIFDSGNVEYRGDGIIVAVLDSGFDYTHTAYTQSVPEDKDKLAMDRSYVASKLRDTNAYALSSALTVSDVYVSDKIPFAYDYADKDSDVYPLESTHGTHVASIIAGKDEQITGVAPNAQLALMKVFSDVDTGAKQTDILNAVDDCVALGVDVINMSLGMTAGFSREPDIKATNAIYEKVRKQGISLIAAASNNYNSTYGSEANGNLPLTSNPDSGTVGTPSTYAAALSVASISGIKTPYIEFEGEPIYYNESSNTAGKLYNFMDMLLGERESGTFEYVTVPGIGKSYVGLDVKGKIALVRRGENTFEEKVQIAHEAGAIGVIVYNNVSGDIRMSVGNYLADWGLGCISMSQDDGEKLAAKPTGTVTLSKSNQAGPFMSDFSSWGPTPDLGIKPEITAHGGDIYAAVPGQKYDRLSGTSMASPNQAGVHALVRQYINEKYPDLGKTEVAAMANQLLMSTADIALDEYGNPYAVRKQGAGLANLKNAVTARAYAYVKGDDGEPLDRTKLELGDDPEKTGVYTLDFTVKNLGDSSAVFDASALVYTEGVSKTLTDRDKTVSTERAYMLSDTAVTVAGSSVSGNRITVAANGETDVTVTLKLTDASKKYIDASFENGMYVEGFVKLVSADGGVSLNIPYLAFYGDWTRAPIFDLTYFETNPDEINEAIDDVDKIKPDAWATRPLGGFYEDYIGFMGSYYFQQDPGNVQIAAQNEHIALTNNTNGMNYIYGVWAGMLRGAKYMDITISDATTGRTVYRKTEENVRKSYNYGSMIGYGNVEIGFHVADYNLKNNSQYTVSLDAHLDYERDGTELTRVTGTDESGNPVYESANLKNNYEFTFTTDFEAPKITDIRYYSEYDDVTKETTWYADIDVYDNHYAQCLRPLIYRSGIISKEYYTPVYGERNGTTTVTIELNDYLAALKDGGQFLLFAYDYALNSAIYEITLPENVQSIMLAEKDITISQYETKLLSPSLYPTDSFSSLLTYSSDDESIARVVNGTLVGVSAGKTMITVSSSDGSVSQRVKVTVLGPGDDGYMRYDRPTVNTFEVIGYRTDFAYYARFSDDRNIGETADKTLFGTRKQLTMYPGESVTLMYDLKAYFPENTEIVYSVGNDSVMVDESGKITALREGETNVTATVRAFGANTVMSGSVSVKVEDPYETSGAYLTTYRGIGEDYAGNVVIDSKLNLVYISQFAFSMSKSVLKDTEPTEEDPYYTTSGPVGEQRPAEYRIRSVYIPEGVEVIDQYAFAYMTSLETVYLPSTLRQINYAAFEGCTSLETVVGLDNVQIISKNAFKDCSKLVRTNRLGSEKFELGEAIALGEGAFSGTAIKSVTLEKVQSAGIGAFENCRSLQSVKFGSKIKIDSGIFAGCTSLTEIEINSPVISADAFAGCVNLTKIKLGADVEEIGANAFANTKISAFEVAGDRFTVSEDGAMLMRNTEGGRTLVAVAPRANLSAGDALTVPAGVTAVGVGAFSHVSGLASVDIGDATRIEDYAFYGLSSLASVTANDKVDYVGNYAFAGSAVSDFALFDAATGIGNYAFLNSALTSVSIADNATVGEGAFFRSSALTGVTVGDKANLGYGAFRSSSVQTVTLGQGVTVGEYAFAACRSLASVNIGGSDGGDMTVIGDYAFALDSSLRTVTGSQYVKSIGTAAFYGYNAETGRVQAPLFTSIDLTGAESIGEHAFAYNRSLAHVTVSDKLQSVGTQAFFNSAVEDFGNFAEAEIIGDYAFAGSALSGHVDLTAVQSVGIGAFQGTKVTSATFAAGSEIPAKLFYGVTTLTSVNGLYKVSKVGDEAFVGTNFAVADLSAATYVGRLAFAQSAVTEVYLGENLRDLGDNPFAYTRLPSFSEKATNEYGANVDVYDFDISDTVKVIDGALYVKVPSGGLELITYSAIAPAKTFDVAEGTVRVSDYAAAGNVSLVNLGLPYTLKSVGHAAFYNCNSLAMVRFGSIAAPVLEAEYDEDYIEHDASGNITNSAQGGLGLAGSSYASEYAASLENVLYNNNFVGYIGKTHGLMMAYPKNGKGYDAYVLDNYFDVKIIAAVVAEEFTKSVVDMIDALPSSATLADEAAVAAARQAYGQIADAEQAALVTNLDKLVAAERRIAQLKNNQQPVTPGGDDPVPEEKEKMSGGMIALIVIVVVLGCGCIALGVLLLLPTLKKKFFGKGKKTVAELAAQDAARARAEKNAASESEQTSEPTESTETTDAPQTSESADNDSKPEAESAEADNKPSDDKPAEKAPAKKSAPKKVGGKTGGKKA